ncbi:retrovirus-related pol polyprotein from transposon TNT 1-94 [Tanacetum coccineum]
MLTPSGGGLILYQAYGNLYAMTGRKAYLLEDKQIPSVGVFDEVFSTWMAFRGNTRDLGSFEEETDKITDLHQISLIRETTSKRQKDIPKKLRCQERQKGSWSDSGEEDDEKAKDETCLLAQASNEMEPDEGDNGIAECSKSRTGNQKIFHPTKALNEGNVIFGSNLRGNIIGKGKICDNKCRVTFSEHDSEITKDDKVIGRGYKAKNIVSTTRCLELLHMDIFNPSAIQSYGGNLYNFVIVDDYSRYSLTRFLKNKTEAFEQFEIFSKKIQNQLGCSIVSIRTDHGREVDNELKFGEFCNANEKKNLENDIEDETLEIDEVVNIKESRNHPLENIIGNLNQRTLRSKTQNQSNFFYLISTIDPKNVNEALTDESWIIAIQEELNQFVANNVWGLVPQPKNMTIMGTKWMFRNKLDENGVVSRNKARLVAQGYNQQEGIDYDETYAPVARLESIRILLVYACALDFKLFQIDVKSAFLNSFINEEVYVAQPPGFIDFDKPDHVYKLKKALYGLKQAPKSWYDRLKAFLIKHEYKIGMAQLSSYTSCHLEVSELAACLENIIFLHFWSCQNFLESAFHLTQVCTPP